MSLVREKLKKPNLDLEKEFTNEFFIGIDEVGRGSWAGPIVACSTWLNPKHFKSIPTNINDSKKLSYNDRKIIYAKLKNFVICGISASSNNEIDQFGLKIANLLAIKRSLYSLLKVLEDLIKIKKKKFIIYIDGSVTPNFELLNVSKFKSLQLPNYQINSVVRGDQKIISISISSILAKVTRDTIMENYDRIFPGYFFSNNFGYGTKQHRINLENNGICKLHRKSFRPMNTIFS